MTSINTRLICDSCKEDIETVTKSNDLLEIIVRLFTKKHEFCKYDLDDEPPTK